MATVVETTAVSFRKGNTTENLAFTGIIGEIVADLGFATSGGVVGVDTNATIRLHNGITRGGIPMARADMGNISTAALAENRNLLGDKNLAYADLSNIESTQDATARERIISTINTYGFTTNSDIQQNLLNYAKIDMSNVLSSTLASGRGDGVNGNLAYTDTSNVNTAFLVNDALHDGTDGNKPLAYKDASNIDTTNLALDTNARPSSMLGPVLATADFNNVSRDVWQEIMFGDSYGFHIESTDNKDNTIPTNPVEGHYPTTSAVKSYVAEQIAAGGFMNSALSNATAYDSLYLDGTQNNYEIKVEITQNATGFVDGTTYPTGIALTNDQHAQGVIVEEVSNGIPTKVNLIYPYTVENITSPMTVVTPSGSQITVTFTSAQSEGYYTHTVTNFTYTGNDFIIQDYYPTTEVLVTPILVATVGIEPSDTTGTIWEVDLLPTYANTPLENRQASIVSATSEVAILTINSTRVAGDIGGAGLLKLDLSNLSGMTDADKAVTEGQKWRIRHDQPIPSPTATSIDASYYSDIATQGAVWDALEELEKNTGTTLLHKNLNETITSTKTFNVSPLVPTAASTDNTTKAASTAFVHGHVTILQNNITAEQNARVAADNTITASVNANTTAISNEVTARTDADNALSARITTNANAITALQNVDTALDGRITANTNDITALETLAGSETLTTEAQTLTGAINELESIVNEEAADLTALENRVTTAEGSITANANNISALDGRLTTAEAGLANTYTKAEVDAKVAATFKYKGTVATYNDLPTEGNTIGDVWNVTDSGANYAWDGSGWDMLGSVIDLTPYLTSADAASTYATIATVNTKANDADVLHKTGNESASGVKTFSDGIVTSTITTQNADLAERYKTDKTYPAGTLVQFGGEKEVTIATTEVNAVISQAPGMILNNDAEGQPLAFMGKVKIRVKGPVKKFDKLVLSSEAGIACKKTLAKQTVIAIALDSNDSEDVKLVKCVTKLTF